MNFLSIEYFLAINRAGGIRKAAEALYISPQALSEHLGKLERELGKPLFIRSNPLTLTEAGEQFRIFSETCMNARKELEQKLAEFDRRQEQYVSIGVPTGMVPPMLLHFLEEFHGEHPECHVRITELPTRTGFLLDIPDTVDAVFSEITGHDEPVCRYTVFSSSGFVVAIHRTLFRSVFGSSAERRIRAIEGGESMELTAFRDCPFILKRSGSVYRENEDRLFRAASFHPQTVMETGDIDMAIRMTRMGNGAVLFPEPVAKVSFRILARDREEAENVLLCPVRTRQESWEIALMYDPYRREPAPLRVLEEAARSYYQRILF